MYNRTTETVETAYKGNKISINTDAFALSEGIGIKFIPSLR
jgi:hypothetical protein